MFWICLCRTSLIPRSSTPSMKCHEKNVGISLDVFLLFLKLKMNFLATTGRGQNTAAAKRQIAQDKISNSVSR